MADNSLSQPMILRERSERNERFRLYRYVGFALFAGICTFILSMGFFIVFDIDQVGAPHGSHDGYFGKVHIDHYNGTFHPFNISRASFHKDENHDTTRDELQKTRTELHLPPEHAVGTRSDTRGGVIPPRKDLRSSRSDSEGERMKDPQIALRGDDRHKDHDDHHDSDKHEFGLPEAHKRAESLICQEICEVCDNYHILHSQALQQCLAALICPDASDKAARYSKMQLKAKESHCGLKIQIIRN